MFFGFACNKLWSTHPKSQEIVDFQFRAIVGISSRKSGISLLCEWGYYFWTAGLYSLQQTFCGVIFPLKQYISLFRVVICAAGERWLSSSLTGVNQGVIRTWISRLWNLSNLQLIKENYYTYRIEKTTTLLSNQLWPSLKC